MTIQVSGETETQRLSLFLKGSGVEVHAEMDVPADLDDAQLNKFLQSVLAQDSSRGGWMSFGTVVIHYDAIAAIVPR